MLEAQKNPSDFIACVKTRKPIQVKSSICNKINSGSNPFSILNNETKHGLQAFFEKNLLIIEKCFFSNKSSVTFPKDWRLC